MAEAVAQFQQRHAESTAVVREQLAALIRDLHQATAAAVGRATVRGRVG